MQRPPEIKSRQIPILNLAGLNLVVEYFFDGNEEITKRKVAETANQKDFVEEDKRRGKHLYTTSINKKKRYIERLLEEEPTIQNPKYANIEPNIKKVAGHLKELRVGVPG
ncbi:hypothetical protein Syun_012054 [Stephania yunnanensis]|uniref:Uncharacterized protein n=1 Tax=Stephania yunnanensis TaxID=152371 RepID=A0AAP0JZH8_9MAGN